jgi:hypothetical protein
MSTRSFIGVECEDGIHGSYCHFDGYLSGVGDTLKNHYNDFMKVCELVNMGDISSLDKTIGDKHDFDVYPHPVDQTTFYMRDRGEDAPHTVFRNEAQYIDSAICSGAEYVYLFKNGKWYFTSSSNDYFVTF